MKTAPCKLNHGPSKRGITVQLRQTDASDAETFAEEAMILCGYNQHGDEARAVRSAAALLNGYFRVKWQADNRDDLGEATAEDLPTVIEMLTEQAASDEGWYFDAGKERKPKPPKEVAVPAEQETFSKAELEAYLAKVGAKAVAVE